MERVAFLIESTGERIGCMLNPESLVVRRTTGLRPRLSIGGELTGARLADDPLLFTGGGRTELELDLLFDVNVAGSTITSDDVRDLTRPLWNLTENFAGDDVYGQPRQVRFVWGKSWNIPGVVAAIAERLEQFTSEGSPQRSWLRLRLWRVGEPPSPGINTESPQVEVSLPTEDLEALPVPEENIGVHEVLGGGEGEEQSSERLDEIAARYYGQPEFWRLIAAFNGIDDPLQLAPGLQLRIPPLSSLQEGL